MSHLQIPFISELDQHYSPRNSTEIRRPSVVSNHTTMTSHSHLQLPLFAAMDAHYSPRPSISEERRPSVAAASNTKTAPVSHSHLNLPLISDLDAYYSPRTSVDERRPSVPEVSPKAVNTTTAASKKHQPSFMESVQSFPWCSGH